MSDRLREKLYKTTILSYNSIEKIVRDIEKINRSITTGNGHIDDLPIEILYKISTYVRKVPTDHELWSEFGYNSDDEDYEDILENRMNFLAFFPELINYGPGISFYIQYENNYSSFYTYASYRSTIINGKREILRVPILHPRIQYEGTLKKVHDNVISLVGCNIRYEINELKRFKKLKKLLTSKQFCNGLLSVMPPKLETLRADIEYDNPAYYNKFSISKLRDRTGNTLKYFNEVRDFAYITGEGNFPDVSTKINVLRTTMTISTAQINKLGSHMKELYIIEKLHDDKTVVETTINYLHYKLDVDDLKYFPNVRNIYVIKINADERMCANIKKALKCNPKNLYIYNIDNKSYRTLINLLTPNMVKNVKITLINMKKFVDKIEYDDLPINKGIANKLNIKPNTYEVCDKLLPDIYDIVCHNDNVVGFTYLFGHLSIKYNDVEYFLRTNDYDYDTYREFEEFE